MWPGTLTSLLPNAPHLQVTDSGLLIKLVSFEKGDRSWRHAGSFVSFKDFSKLDFTSTKTLAGKSLLMLV